MTTATISPHDTTVLLREHETDYLLVSAHSARATMAKLERTKAEIAEQANPLRERAHRLWKAAAAVRMVSGVVAAVGAGALVWHSMVNALPVGYEAPLWALLIAGALGYVCGFAMASRADSVAGEATFLERTPVVELLGGIFLPEDEFPLPDGSLLVNVRHRSSHLLVGAESLTREQRNRVVALTKRGLLEQAVEALDRVGREETNRLVQEAVRTAEDERSGCRTPLLRILRGKT